MPKQIELSREVEEACVEATLALTAECTVGQMASVVDTVKDIARAIIAQVREEGNDGLN